MAKLAEAQIGQTVAKLELPHSYADVSIGDVLVLGDQDAEASYRVDRVVFSDSLEVEATRVEIGAYRPVEFVDLPVKGHGYLPLLPVSSLFLDLPLIRGDEVAHAPHVAVVSEPWQGSVAIFDAASGAGFALNRFVDQGAIVGVTQTALEACETAVWDRGPALEIKLVSGQLESRQLFDVLGGANTVAIGDGTPENWEVFQFADAQLVAEGTFAVSNRIRGLFGTEVSADWPAGSYVVLLDDAVGQLNLPLSSRGLDRNYLVGPARRPYSDPSYTLHSLAFDGVGLRPLAPVHLSATAQTDGSVSLDWVRRTRIDGDNWASMNVPLGEESELYHLEFRSNGQLFREATCTQQGFVYSQAMQVSDAVSGNVEISVAQVSASFGPGKYQRIIINV